MSLNSIYQVMGISRQGVHKQINGYMKEEETKSYLEVIIRQIRVDHPTISCRAMYYMINPESIGRDKFELWCKELGFRSIHKFNRMKTTNSLGVHRFENLVLNYRPTRINEVYYSDITYFRVGNQFYYLTFIIDGFSRYIVGYSVGRTLDTESTVLPALWMAIKNRRIHLIPGIIFHSDGGGQYFAKIFLDLTRKYQFRNSMCEYAYENGMAERINGIIKNNYLNHRSIKNESELIKEVDRSVTLYNTQKPHKNLKNMPPEKFEKQYLFLTQPTQPIMMKSLEANTSIFGASSPKKLRANPASNSECISANNFE